MTDAEPPRQAPSAPDERPDEAESLHRLGVAAHRSGDDARAAALLARSAVLDDGRAEVQEHLGLILLRLGRPAEAEPCFRRAAELVPGSAAAQLGLGDARHLLGDRDGAVPHYGRALGLDPSCRDAWWGLGCALLERGRYAEAAAALERVAALDPASAGARHNLGKALFELGLAAEAVDALRDAAERWPDGPSRAMLATIVPGDPRASDREVLAIRRRWAATLPVGEAPPPRRGEGPRRLGYVSAHFGRRNWMKPVWGVINRHDRGRFEVHLFSDGPEAAVGPEYRRHPADRFHDTRGLDDAALADLVRREGVDVLVDLNGYSRPGRLAVFALRPAPKLVTWFNMYGPPGLDAFDALVGDATVAPAGSEADLGAPVVRVPGTYLAFEVGYPVPDVAPPPCLRRAYVTFGCLAPQYKIGPGVAAAWAEILARVPGSRLLLKSTVLGHEGNRRAVLDLLGRAGVAADRVDLEGPEEHHAFLGAYARVDVALDTFPYNGGTTTMEALWQGVPVVTFAGDGWASRIGASLLRAAGLPDLVAPDLPGYVALAVGLAGDPGRLDAIRATLRDRLRVSPACDPASLALALESQDLDPRGRADDGEAPPGPTNPG